MFNSLSVAQTGRAVTRIRRLMRGAVLVIGIRGVVRSARGILFLLAMMDWYVHVPLHEATAWLGYRLTDPHSRFGRWTAIFLVLSRAAHRPTGSRDSPHDERGRFELFPFGSWRDHGQT